MFLVRVPNRSEIEHLSSENRLEAPISKRIHSDYYNSQGPLDVENVNLVLNQLVLNATSACVKI